MLPKARTRRRRTTTVVPPLGSTSLRPSSLPPRTQRPIRPRRRPSLPRPSRAEVGESAPEGAPKRKRSRRGSRGGRKRKKPAASGNGDSAADGDDDTPEADEGTPEGDVVASPSEAAVAVDGSDEGVPEYVPMSEWIDDFESRKRG